MAEEGQQMQDLSVPPSSEGEPPKVDYYPPPSEPPTQPTDPAYPPPGPATLQPSATGYAPAPGAPQKGQPNWMPPPPQVPADCPPGLEYLTQVDQLLVHQQVELFEIMSGWETANRYEVKNALGQQVYFAAEESDCCLRQYCGSSRPFEMTIIDNTKKEVIHIKRPLNCSSSLCGFCCLQVAEVQSPPGTVVGYVKQEFDLIYPNFTIRNAEDEVVLRIKGPFFTCTCGKNINFTVTTPDGETEVGKISKQWSGLVKELFTDADNFGITFPMDLDVKMKAVMLGACFLIDFMYYEDDDND